MAAFAAASGPGCLHKPGCCILARKEPRSCRACFGLVLQSPRSLRAQADAFCAQLRHEKRYFGRGGAMGLGCFCEWGEDELFFRLMIYFTLCLPVREPFVNIPHYFASCLPFSRTERGGGNTEAEKPFLGLQQPSDPLLGRISMLGPRKSASHPSPAKSRGSVAFLVTPGPARAHFSLAHSAIFGSLEAALVALLRRNDGPPSSQPGERVK